MIFPHTFAPAVPLDVREWSQAQIDKTGSLKIRQEISGRIRRLTYYGTRKILWNKLGKLKESNPKLDLLELIRTAVTAPSEFQRLSKEPIHVVKQDAADLARNAQQMSRNLKSLMGRVSLPNRHHISLYGVAMTAANESANPSHKVLINDTQLQSELMDFERYAPDLPELVAAMAVILKIISVDEAKLRPKKMQATNAERTFVIRTLKRYFVQTIGRIPLLVVATLVNLTLDRADTVSDTVRKTTH